MSGSHNSAPTPARYAHEVDPLPGEAPDLTPEMFINKTASEYTERGYALQLAMGQNKANLQRSGRNFELQDGTAELIKLSSLVTEGRTPTVNDKEVFGYIDTLRDHNVAESRVNVDLLESDLGVANPPRSRRAVPGSVEDVRDRANNRAQNVLTAHDRLLLEHGEAQRAGDFEKMATLKDEVNQLWSYHTQLKEQLSGKPKGTEVANFVGSFLAEEDLAARNASANKLHDQALVTVGAREKMHAAEHWLQTEADALKVLGRFFPATPHDATAENTPLDPRLEVARQLPADQQEAVRAQHAQEQERLTGIREELQESREAYANRNSTLFKRLVGGVALRGLKVGVYHARKAKQNRDANLKTNDKMSPDKRASIIARRSEARRRDAPEKPISEKERYRMAAEAYYDEVNKNLLANPEMTNEQRGQLRAQAAVNEMRELRIETNRRAKNTMIGKANRWMMEHKKTTIAIALGVTAVTGGWGGLLVGAKLSAALLGSAKLDTMMRGKMAEDGKWLEHSIEDMKRHAAGGGDFNSMMEKGINKYRLAVAGEMGKRAVSAAGGGLLWANLGIPAVLDAGSSLFDYTFDSKTYSSPFNRLIPDSNPFAGIWDTLDEATTRTTPDGSYGARAMSNRIGMN